MIVVLLSRYQACLAAGMKTSWVLSDEEKEERTVKKQENRLKKFSTSHTPLAMPSSPSSSTTSNSDLLCGDEERQIEEWLTLLDSTKVSIAMPDQVLSEMNALHLHDSTMSQQSIIEFFKVVYSRVVQFVGFVTEFDQLHKADKRSLLAANLDMLANIRLVTCFSPKRTGRDVKEQLGRIFIEPWAKSPMHSIQYLAVMTRLSRFCSDKVTGLLYQVVALFHHVPDLEQPEVIQLAQEQMARLLQKHLVASLGCPEGNLVFANLIVMLHDLRMLADTLTG